MFAYAYLIYTYLVLDNTKKIISWPVAFSLILLMSLSTLYASESGKVEKYHWSVPFYFLVILQPHLD